MPAKKENILIALGGNALLSKGKMTFVAQEAEAKKTAHVLMPLIKKAGQVVITHGNGPQVGALLKRSEFSKKHAYSCPLSACVAQSQGEIALILKEAMLLELKRHRIGRLVTPIISHVFVSKNDPAFKAPSKPIGPFYKKRPGKGYALDAGRGYRKLVASPKPIEIFEKKDIELLSKNGSIVIACGGGGIPLVRKGGSFDDVEAVIDKDYASALLASDLKMDTLLFISSVSCVYLNYLSNNKVALRELSLKDAKKYLKEGQFAKGSMAPKIEAAISFLQKGGKKVIITDRKNLGAGTIIKK